MAKNASKSNEIDSRYQIYHCTLSKKREKSLLDRLRVWVYLTLMPITDKTVWMLHHRLSVAFPGDTFIVTRHKNQVDINCRVYATKEIKIFLQRTLFAAMIRKINFFRYGAIKTTD